ncbi:class I SAM-dependent methyltransferase [Candidatus Saccharibacteria bacterium]|nr:class I SAM-dependent methyltransferase [Candidatus Saccharibacteria bacterium]
MGKPEIARENIEAFVDFVESQPDFAEPDQDALQRFLDFQKPSVSAGVYETGRSKNHIAPLINMSVTELEDLCKGKLVLDVGCGVGKLSRDVAMLKGTRVVALDHDPEVLEKVPRRKNIEVVEGSAFDLEQTVGIDEFDIIFSSYSSLYWAGSLDEIEKSIKSARAVCKIGGVIVFVPLLDNLQHRKEAREYLVRTAPKQESPKMIEVITNANTRNWLDVAKFKTLIAEEEKGKVNCVFVPGKYNGNKGKRDQVTGKPPETYSVFVEVQENE